MKMKITKPINETSQTISRRNFLGQASCAAVGSTCLFSTLLNLGMTNSVAAQGLQNTSTSQSTDNVDADDYKALVCILLAGGNDSFNMLVPRDNAQYAEYKQVRSDLALPQESLLSLNQIGGGMNNNGREFGVHSGMPEMQQLFNEGNLAFVANVGTLVEPTTKASYESGAAKLPLGLFSHNDQIEHWQTSVPDQRTAYGWGGRVADILNSANQNDKISMNISLSGSNTFQAGRTVAEYSIGPNGARQLAGYEDYDVDEPALLAQVRTTAINSMLDMQYRNIFEQTFINTTRNALDAYQVFNSAVAQVQPFTTPFSKNELSQSLEMAAKTIASRDRLGMKRQTFFVLFGGWDHHDEVLNTQGAMLPVLSKALSEFNAALTELGMADKVTTFTTSDFGRTLTSNGRGSDHAWGGNHIVMGGAVQGGQIYGEYPSLYANNPLDTGRGRLIPTTSVDEYFAELALWFGVPRSELSNIFPNINRFYSTSIQSTPLGMFRQMDGLDGSASPAPSLMVPQQNHRIFLPNIRR